MWPGVAGALLEELKPTGSVITVREPRVGVGFTLSDDLRGSPDFFLSNSGVDAEAARASTCDSDKLRDNTTAAFRRGAKGVSSLKFALAGVGVDCSGGRIAGKRWPRIRRGGMSWLTNSDCDEWAGDAEVVVELSDAWVALVGVGGKT